MDEHNIQGTPDYVFGTVINEMKHLGDEIREIRSDISEVKSEISMMKTAWAKFTGIETAVGVLLTFIGAVIGSVITFFANLVWHGK